MQVGRVLPDAIPECGREFEDAPRPAFGERLFEEHEQRDVVPFVCALDDVMSELMGMGLERIGTRALGAERCDFRYRPGRDNRPLKSLRSFPVVGD